MFFPSYNVQSRDTSSRSRRPALLVVLVAVAAIAASVLVERQSREALARARADAKTWNAWQIEMNALEASAERLDASFDRQAELLERLGASLGIEDAK